MCHTLLINGLAYIKILRFSMGKKQQVKLLPLYAFLKKIDYLIKNGVEGIQTTDERFIKSMESLKRCRYALGVEFLEIDSKNILKEFKTKMLSSESKAFLFGAGISANKPFKLPMWSTLLQRSFIGDFYKDTEIAESVKYKDFLKLLTSNKGNSDNFFNSFDLYELAQFIEDNRKQINRTDDSGKFRTVKEMQMLTDGEMFEIVKTALVLDLKEDKNWEEKNGSFEYISSKWKKKNLISYLSKCVDKYNIDRILTYNYDNAFEYTCEKVIPKKEIRTVFLDAQLVDKNDKAVPVYHVHGYLPLFLDEFSNSNDYKSYLDYPEAKKLILSEESYADVEHSSYKWRNVVQIDTFLRYNCIFFGFSATDKNFKRIVKLMDWHSERECNEFPDDIESSIRHYIFLDVGDFIKNIFNASLSEIIKVKFDFLNGGKDPISNLELLVTKLQCLYFTVRTKRKYLKKMHIYPIWVTKEKVLEHLVYCLE